MKLFFHTIALEPARWTPRRTSFRLIELLRPIAESGFNQLEIYEPHLNDDCIETRDCLDQHQLQAPILSSYINLNPAVTSDAELSAGIEVLKERIQFFGFKTLRLFPGVMMSPEDTVGIHQFMERLRALAQQLPQIEMLIETHDHSLADDFHLPVRIVEEIGLPNLGLLYQPTIFAPEKALEQWSIQKHLVRHLHFQNRKPDLSFGTIQEGIIDWKSIVTHLSPDVNATLEFVPVGICSVEQFNLDVTLAQARSEADYIRQIS